MSFGVCVRVWGWRKENRFFMESQIIATSKAFDKPMTGHSKPSPKLCIQVPDPKASCLLDITTWCLSNGRHPLLCPWNISLLQPIALTHGPSYSITPISNLLPKPVGSALQLSPESLLFSAHLLLPVVTLINITVTTGNIEKWSYHFPQFFTHLESIPFDVWLFPPEVACISHALS